MELASAELAPLVRSESTGVELAFQSGTVDLPGAAGSMHRNAGRAQRGAWVCLAFVLLVLLAGGGCGTGKQLSSSGREVERSGSTSEAERRALALLEPSNALPSRAEVV